MKLDKAILSLRHAASTDQRRQNLSGIYFDAGKAVATNGHLMATMETEPSELSPCILSATDAAAIAKAMGKADAEINVAGANLNGHIPVTIGTTEMKPAKVEGTFPDYVQVMPKGDTSFSFTFNADLLWQLVEIAKASDQDGKKRGIVTIEIPAGSLSDKQELVGPMRVVASNSPRFTGLLMPCRK